MIAYRDFMPEKLPDRKWVISPPSEYESLDSVVSRANEWIQHSRIRVIHVQTMLIPGLDAGNRDTHLGVFYIGPIERWTQIVHVWYEMN